MTLDQLTDEPQLSIGIGGRLYRFSELPIEGLGRLQAWLKANCVHPVTALKDHLDGLPDRDRERLLEAARREGRDWPPQVGTAAGAAALLGTEPGQIEALYEGLRVHQPETSRELAVRIFRQLRRDAGKLAAAARKEGREYDGEGPARLIFATLFGLEDPDDELDLPKDRAPEGANGRLTGR